MNGLRLYAWKYIQCREIRIRRSIESTGHNDSNNSNYESDNIDDEHHPCFSFSFLLDFCNSYYIPSIILLGLVGNILSCIVFLTTHLKMRSSSYYLAALSTTDLTFLVTLLFVWLNSILGWRVFNEHGWCEILVYISAVCSSLSAWLIVAFTVERFIAVQYPLQRPQMCTISRAKTIILMLIVFSSVCHSYTFITAGVIETGDGIKICDLKYEYMDVMKVINIIDSIASLILPIVLIVVMNTMIMRNLLEFGRRFKQTPMTSILLTNQCPSKNRSDLNLNQLPSNSNSHNGIIMGQSNGKRSGSQQSFQSSKKSNSHHSSSSSGTGAVVAAITAANRSSPLPPSSSLPRNPSYQVQEFTKCISMGSSSKSVASARNQQNITKMLLLISTVFIFLNLPSYVIRLCIFFFTLTKRDSPDLFWCLQQFFMLLYYTNFSINFLLYAMCGVTFRRCLEQLLQKVYNNLRRYIGRQRRNSNSS